MKRLHDDHDSKQCLLDTFRRAVEKAGGESSVAAHLGVSVSYISQILNDKSPLGVRVILKSPDAVQKFMAEAWIEYHGGVVIWPATDEKTALRHLAGALLSPALALLKLAVPAQSDERKAG